jgi:transcriptional/translational regulatory protein YebC/TACO1
MAGHSHAKNIMHRKAAQGAKKAQAFGKLIREISVSAKQGLPDPAMNPRLRAAVKAALVANMTRDTIDRAIKRAATAGVGGALGETNSVAFQFERKGVLRYPAAAADADTMLEAAIEAGAGDVESGEEGHEVSCAVEDFASVRDALEARFGTAEAAKLEWWPTTTVDLDEERAREVLKLLDADRLCQLRGGCGGDGAAERLISRAGRAGAAPEGPAA